MNKISIDTAYSHHLPYFMPPVRRPGILGAKSNNHKNKPNAETKAIIKVHDTYNKMLKDFRQRYLQDSDNQYGSSHQKNKE
ncbi:hypothetical protein [Parabacteroides goldsteinii]|uniref:hypothetical protein n=1 Tax=Parabacteroides goldsteinii TaxID=328812 RepID=UPI0025A3C6DA|nr:hypothetical protein [Parabacteroides goldsteinii]